MPKAAPYRLTWDSEQEVYTLCDNSGERVLSMTSDNQEWFALLANITSFSFCGQHGQLTIRQEARPSGGAYWYAFHSKQVPLTRDPSLEQANLSSPAPSIVNEALHSSPKSKPVWKTRAWLLRPRV